MRSLNPKCGIRGEVRRFFQTVISAAVTANAANVGWRWIDDPALSAYRERETHYLYHVDSSPWATVPVPVSSKHGIPAPRKKRTTKTRRR